MTKERIRRNWARVETTHIVAFMKESGKNQTELADIIGVKGGSLSQWIRENNAPKWSLLAIEALKRRTQGSSAFEAEKITALEEEIKQLKDGQTVEAGAAQRLEGQSPAANLDKVIMDLLAIKYGVNLDDYK